MFRRYIFVYLDCMTFINLGYKHASTPTSKVHCQWNHSISTCLNLDSTTSCWNINDYGRSVKVKLLSQNCELKRSLFNVFFFSDLFLHWAYEVLLYRVKMHLHCAKGKVESTSPSEEFSGNAKYYAYLVTAMINENFRFAFPQCKCSFRIGFNYKRWLLSLVWTNC